MRLYFIYNELHRVNIVCINLTIHLVTLDWPIIIGFLSNFLMDVKLNLIFTVQMTDSNHYEKSTSVKFNWRDFRSPIRTWSCYTQHADSRHIIYHCIAQTFSPTMVNGFNIAADNNYLDVHQNDTLLHARAIRPHRGYRTKKKIIPGIVLLLTV